MRSSSISKPGRVTCPAKGNRKGKCLKDTKKMVVSRKVLGKESFKKGRVVNLQMRTDQTVSWMYDNRKRHLLNAVMEAEARLKIKSRKLKILQAKYIGNSLKHFVKRERHYLKHYPLRPTGKIRYPFCKDFSDTPPSSSRLY